MSRAATPSAVVRIALVDDHPLIMDGIENALRPLARARVVCKAHSGAQLLATFRSGIAADLAFVDIRMPQMDGFEVLARLKEEFPLVRSIVLSLESCSVWVRRAHEQGACGYLLKDADAGVIRAAVAAVHGSGTCWWQPQAADGSDTIKEEHLRFLELLFDPLDHPYKRIADIMHVAPSTVDGYSRLLGKRFGVHTRSALIREALRRNLVPAQYAS